MGDMIPYVPQDKMHRLWIKTTNINLWAKGTRTDRIPLNWYKKFLEIIMGPHLSPDAAWVAWWYEILWLDFKITWVYQGGSRVLHGKESLDGLDFTFIWRICQCLPLGGQAHGSQPLSILFFLKNRKNKRSD